MDRVNLHHNSTTISLLRVSSAVWAFPTSTAASMIGFFVKLATLHDTFRALGSLVFLKFWSYIIICE